MGYSRERPLHSPVLHVPPSLSLPLCKSRKCSKSRYTHPSLMIESPNLVTMSVSLYIAHTHMHTNTLKHTQIAEHEASTPFRAREVRAPAEGHTTRHLLLMDDRHYSSWGQVPLTIKGPGQRLGKNGSGSRGAGGKENCCRRTGKHKRCRRNPGWRDEGRGRRALEEEETNLLGSGFCFYFFFLCANATTMM